MPTRKNNNKNPTAQPKRVAEGNRAQNKNINRKMPRHRKRNKRENKARAVNEDDRTDHGEPTTDEPGRRIFSQKGANNPRKDHMTHHCSGNMDRNRASTVDIDGKTTQNTAYLKNLTT